MGRLTVCTGATHSSSCGFPLTVCLSPSELCPFSIHRLPFFWKTLYFPAMWLVSDDPPRSALSSFPPFMFLLQQPPKPHRADRGCDPPPVDITPSDKKSWMWSAARAFCFPADAFRTPPLFFPRSAYLPSNNHGCWIFDSAFLDNSIRPGTPPFGRRRLSFRARQIFFAFPVTSRVTSFPLIALHPFFLVLFCSPIRQTGLVSF